MQDIVEQIALCVARGKISRSFWYPPEMKDQDGADEIASEALKNGVQPNVLLEGCMLGMERIGKEFGEEKAFVTNLIVSAEAMKAVMKHLQPFLDSGEVQRKGKFVIGTVSGDMHDIGKNLVSMIIKGGGFEVIDLGVDVPTNKFLDAIAQHRVVLSGFLPCSQRRSGIWKKTLKPLRKRIPTLKYWLVVLRSRRISALISVEISIHLIRRMQWNI